MMCLFTIFWVAGLTLTVLVHQRRMNKFLSRINKNLEKLYEQESKKREGEENKTEEDPDA